MPFTIDMFRHMSMKDIGDLCKEHKVKSFTTLKLDAMLEKLNYVPDSDSSEKKTRTRKCPKVQAKKHQGETMKGEDGNDYTSMEKNEKWSWKKTGSNSASTSDDEGTEKNEIIATKPVEDIVDVEESAVDVEETPVVEETPTIDEVEPEIEIEVVKKEKKSKKEPKEVTEKKERQSPSEKAKDHPNERMKGNDGNWWESKANKNDVYTWKKST